MKTIKLLFATVLAIILSVQSGLTQDYVPVIEVKAAPLKFIVGNFNVGTEFVLNDRIGIEPILDLSLIHI